MPAMDPRFAETAEAALAAAKKLPGVSYADVRVSDEEHDLINLRNRELQRLSRTTSAGVGVRVLRNGAWGFAALPDPCAEVGEKVARQAAEIAAGVAIAQSSPIRMAEEEPQVGRYETPMEEDPFQVSIERRLDDLNQSLDIMRGDDFETSPIQSVSALMQWHRTKKLFMSSEGSRLEQVLTFGGAGIKLVATDDDGAVQRTWPFDYDGGLASAGYETVGKLRLNEHAGELREDALALLKAPLCPSGNTTLILDTPQLALQIHESCGHPTEADRAVGDEISLAGASFLTPDRLGRFTYGSTLVNLVADSRAPGGLGTFGWDDEGVPARITPLISRGVFVGYLSSRETAASMNLGRSAGCMRAESWNRPAIIRMLNVSLEPDPNGPSSLDELIGDTEDGIMMANNTSWSIDDLRLNFQFGCEAAWEIKKGKRTRLLRSPMYTGSTPKFWGGCDAIGNDEAFRLWGLASCGKGDPMQTIAVGHGCAPARFRDVEVGASR